jgi:hypothetical protein
MPMVQKEAYTEGLIFAVQIISLFKQVVYVHFATCEPSLSMPYIENNPMVYNLKTEIQIILKFDPCTCTGH